MNLINQKYDIIIDTDCAIDDLRAITMLFALQDVNVKAIITSDGTLSPKNGAIKVTALLKSLGRSDVPVGIGRKFNKNPPPWRKFNSTIYWGDESDIDITNIQCADKLLQQVFSNAQNEITLVCLGPLSNFTDLFVQTSGYLQKVRCILWYIESLYPVIQGSNYTTDIISANLLLHSGIKFFCISSLGKPLISIDENYISAISSLKTIYSNAILNSFISPGMDEKLQTRHLKLWDDLVPLFMFAPQYFRMNILPNNKNIFYTIDYNIIALRKHLFSILSGSYIYKEETLSEYSENLIKQMKLHE